jgi:PAS domain S-box-containing protein
MSAFTYITPAIYWALVLLWSFILVFYLRRWRVVRAENRLLAILLTVLAIDAFRTLFESIYFGLRFTSTVGLISPEVAAVLERAEFTFIPKWINLMAAAIVIVLLLRRWLPEEEALRHQETIRAQELEHEVAERTRQLSSDILRRQEVETALRDSERTLATLLTNLPGMAYRCLNDPEYTMMFVSEGVHELIGYEPEEIVGNAEISYGEIVHPEDAQAVWTTIQQAVDLNIPFQMVYRIRTRAGEYKWVWEQGRGVHDDKGNLLSLEGFITDISEQKSAQEALQQQSDFNAKLIETSPVFYLALDAGGRIIMVNAAMLQATGYERSDLIGEDYLHQFVPEEERTWLSGEYDRMVDSERPVHVASHVLTRDGRQLLVDWHGRGVRTAAGQFERRFRTVLEHTRDLLYQLDLRTMDYAFISPSSKRVAGFTPDEMKAMGPHGVMNHIHPEDRPLVRARFKELLQSPATADGGALQVEYRWWIGAKEYRWASETRSIIRDEAGTPIAVVGSSRDVTDWKNAEQEMSRIRQYLRSIIDAMPSVIVAVDPLGNVTHWNERARELTGRAVDTVQGCPFEEVYPLEDAQVRQIRGALETGEWLQNVRFTQRPENGRLEHWEMMVYPIGAEEGGGAVIRLENVTTRVEFEEMMVQTEKMMSLGGLAAGMAHEINNPLGGILQACQNVERRTSADLARNREVAQELGIDIEAVRRYLDERGVLDFIQGIRSDGARAAKIVSDMLAFSRRSESQFTLVSVQEVFDIVLRLAMNDYDLKKHFDFRRIVIKKEFDENLPEVRCDTTKLEQVLLNLVKNAAHAMAGQEAPPPVITLRAFRENDHARLEVEDNGPGMDEVVRRRVFEPFFTTKEVGTGTGLGLSVSYFIIVKQHRGSLAVESTPGKGTRFVLRLPLHEDA